MPLLLDGEYSNRTKLKELSDFELNLIVAKIEFPMALSYMKGTRLENCVDIFSNSGVLLATVEYCQHEIYVLDLFVLNYDLSLREQVIDYIMEWG